MFFKQNIKFGILSRKRDKNRILSLFLVLVVSLFYAVQVRAATYYVNGSCSNNGDGSSSSCGAEGGPGACNTIQAAIDKSVGGDTVKIIPYSYAASSDVTIYNENLVISNEITLETETTGLPALGMPASWLVVNGDADSDKIGDNGNATIAWTGGVAGTLQDITVTGGFSQVSQDAGGIGAGVLLGGKGTNVNIIGLVVRDNDNGIVVRYGAAPTINSCVIYNNDKSAVVVRDASSPVIGGGNCGGNPKQCNDLNANQIYRNSIKVNGSCSVGGHSDCEQERSSGCAAIAVMDASLPQIWGNKIYGNTYTGIIAMGQSVPSIRWNKIFQNGRVGIGLLSAGQGIEIINNWIQNNERGIGIQSSGDPCNRIVIKNNDIVGNDYLGIASCNAYLQIGGSAAEGNRIYNNQHDGIFLALDSDAEVRYNNIFNNHWGGIVLFGSKAVIENNLIAENGIGQNSSSFGHIEIIGGRAERVNNNLIVGGKYDGGGFEGVGILAREAALYSDTPAILNEVKDNIICRVGLGIQLLEDWGFGTINNYRPGAVDRNLVSHLASSSMDTDGLQDGYLLGGNNKPGTQTYYYGLKTGSYGVPPASPAYYLTDPDHEDEGAYPDFLIANDANSPVYTVSSYALDPIGNYLGLPDDFNYIDDDGIFKRFKFRGTFDSLNPEDDLIAPFVAEVIPEDGAVEISRSQVITIRLQDDGVGIDTSSVRIDLSGDGGTDADCIYCDISTSGNSSNLEIVHVPASLLAANTIYTLQIEADDLRGNHLSVSRGFATGDNETVLPEIKDLTPAIAASDVAVDSPVQFKVRDSGCGVNPDSIRLEVDSVEVTVDKTALNDGSGSAPDYFVYYKPASPFNEGETINLHIYAEDNDSNIFSMDSSFTTANDTVAPKDVSKLRAYIKGTSSIKLSWIPSENKDCDIANYPYILYTDHGSGYDGGKVLDSLPYTAASYTATQLSEGIYAFKLRVRDTIGNESVGTEIRNILLATSIQFEDDFEGFYDEFSGTLDKWETPGSAWTINSGELQFSGAGSQLTQLIMDNLERNDFNYQAKVKLNSSATGDAAWLIVRNKAASVAGITGYVAKIGVGSTSNIGIYELSLTGIKPLEITDSNIVTGTWYNVRLEAEGNELKLYVGAWPNSPDLQVTAVDSNNSFASGQIGLWQPNNSNADVSFDYVQVDYNKTVSSGIYRYNASSSDWTHDVSTNPNDHHLVFNGAGDSELLVIPLSLSNNFIYKAKFNINSGGAGFIVNKAIGEEVGQSGYLVEISTDASNNINIYSLPGSTPLPGGTGTFTILADTEYELWIIKRGNDYEVVIDQTNSIFTVTDSTHVDNSVAGFYGVALSNVAYDDLSISPDVPSVDPPTIIYPTDGYSEIQAAINASDPGDTVLCSSGSYDIGNNTIIMKEGVSLKAQTIVTGCGAKTVTITGSKTLIVAANAVRIEGFKLYGDSINTGVRVSDTSPVIINNEITNCYDGVRISSSGNNAYAAPIVQSNCIHDNNRNGISNSFESAALIVDNDIYNNAKHGIANQLQAAPTIKGNRVYGNVQTGIANRDQSYATIRAENDIHDNILRGIGIQDNAQPSIQNNYVYSNLENGISIQGDANPNVYSNYVYKNYKQGVGCRANASVNIVNNWVYSNCLSSTDCSGIGFKDFSGTALVDGNEVYHQSSNNNVFGVGVISEETTSSTGIITFSNNTIRANLYGGVGFFQNPDMQLITFVDNTVTSNGIYTPGVDETPAYVNSGIQIETTANVVIEHNIISSNATDGISIRNCSPFIGWDPAVFYGWAAQQYAANYQYELNSNTHYKALYDSYGTWHEDDLSGGNIIRNNLRSGIVVDGELETTTPIIKGNIIELNNGFGISAQNQYASVTVFGNSMKNNAYYALVTRDNAEVTSENNYFEDDIRARAGSTLSLINGNYIDAKVLGDGHGTKVYIQNYNYISAGINCHNCGGLGGTGFGTKWYIEEYNEIITGIHLRGIGTNVYLKGHNKVHDAYAYGIEKQNSAAVYAWDGNEFYNNRAHMRSHSGDFYIIGYTEFDPETKEYGGDSSPNIFHDAYGWGIAGGVFEVKQGSLTIINNIFYDNGIHSDLYPILRYGCCGGGTLTIKENLFYNNGEGFKISGNYSMLLDIEDNEFYSHWSNVIGFEADHNGAGYISGSISYNKIYNNPNGVAIGFNPGFLDGDLRIMGNEIYGNKQGIGISGDTQGNGHKFLIGSGTIDDWNFIYDNLSVGISGRDSSAEIDINGNDIFGNGINPPADFNYGSGIMFKDYSGAVTVRNNLIERNKDNGIQFRTSSVSMTISSNTIRYNGRANDEGGIRVQEGGTGNITGNKIYANYDDGIAVRGTSEAQVDVTISDNEIYQNGWNWELSNWNSLYDPSGIGVSDYSTVIIQRNKIYNNGNGSTHDISAGVSFNMAAGAVGPKVFNNFVYGHKNFGINMRRLSAQLLIYGNTIADNDYGIYRGLDDSPFVQPEIINTIAWGNTTASIDSDYGNFTPTVSYSDIQGAGVYSGTGNINSDPLFIDAGASNYRIDIDSSCFDAGVVVANLTEDFDKDSRPRGSAVDIGADEIPPSPEMLSAIANDASSGGTGIQNGDQVVIIFSSGTNAPPINASNINTMFALNNLHSWLDGDLNIGSAEWSTTTYGDDTLTITVSTTGGIPTVAVGDSITLDGNIKDYHNSPILDSIIISGSFDGISGIVAHWRFDEGVDSTAYDATGNGYNGTLYGADWYTSGYVSNALEFNGTGDYVAQPLAPVYAANESFSFETWFKTSTADSASLLAAVAENGTNDAGLEININQVNAGKINCRIADVAGKVVNVYGSTTVNDNNWHHLVVARDGAAKELTLFIDNVREDFATDITTGNINLSGYAFRLGARNNQGSNDMFFAGILDEVYVYNRALSSDEVQDRFDFDAPYLSSQSPINNAVSIPADTNISLHIQDDGTGVDRDSIIMRVNDDAVAYMLTGRSEDYTLVYDPPSDFSSGEVVTVRIEAQDMATFPNLLDTTYTFRINRVPETPQNNNPANGQMGLNWLPTLSASAFSDLDSGETHQASQWQVALNDTFLSSEIVYDSGVTTSNLESDAVDTALSPDSTYFWHVLYQDGIGEWSAPSAATTFKTRGNSPPNTPSNNSPGNGATGLTVEPVLQATAFSDPDLTDGGDTHQASQWQLTPRWDPVNEEPDFNSPIIDSGELTDSLTSYTPQPLMPNITYYWRVRYKDAHGAWSLYSSPTSFETENYSPYDIVDQYQIDYDPEVASVASDFRVKFTPYAGATPCAGAKQVLLVAYENDGVTEATGTLSRVAGYDSSGPILVAPVVDASANGQVTAVLRYDKNENIKIKLIDVHGVEGAGLTNTISVGAGGQIVNGDFEIADLSGWIIESGDVGIYNNVYTCNTSSKMGGSPDAMSYTSGVMRSEIFTLYGSEIALCYGHKRYINSGYIGLYLAADDTEIAVQVDDMPTGPGSNMAYWDLGPAYVGKEVYLKFVDYSTDYKRDFNIDDIKYMETLNNYTINFVPALTSSASVFHIDFTPYGTSEARIGDEAVEIKTYVYNAISGEWEEQVPNRLKKVSGYDVDGYPVLADPIVDASAGGLISVSLHYDQEGQIKIKLVDSEGVESALSGAIDILPASQIVNGDFETGDLSGWFVESGISGVSENMYECNTSNYVGGSPTDGNYQAGVLRSEVFILNSKAMNFCYAHKLSQHPTGYIALYLAANDNQIAIQIDDLPASPSYWMEYATAHWDLAEHVGKGVYIKIVDGTYTNDRNFEINADDFRYVALGTPTNISPIGGVSDIILTPTLQASAFDSGTAGGVHAASEWQISTDSGDNFEDNIVYSVITESGLETFTITESLQTAMNYYWRVRYRNNYNVWTDYSSETAFSTILTNTLPAAPDNDSPADGAKKVINVPLLKSTDFSDTDGGDTHVASRWQISSSQGVSFEDNTVYDSGTSSDLTIHRASVTPLASASTYYWRVRHQDDKGGWSAYSDETSFTTKAIPTNTVARWFMDEGEGTTAYDASGNGYHGTMNGASWTSGHSSYGLEFNGTSACLEQTYTPLYTTSDSFSYEMWFKTATADSGSLLAVTAENGTNDAALEININEASAGMINCRIADVLGNVVNVEGDITVNDNSWHHLVLVRDGVAKEIVLYIDNDATPVTASDTTSGNIDLSSYAFSIGARNNRGSQDMFFTGNIDEVILYNTALSPVWIEDAYNATVPYTSGHAPAKNAVNVKPYQSVVLHVLDDGVGIDSNTIRMVINGNLVELQITGDSNDYTLTYSPVYPYFVPGDTVQVAVDASDLLDYDMAQDVYTFTIIDNSVDVNPPVADSPTPLPAPGETNADTVPTIVLHVKDDGALNSGVDETSIELKVDGVTVIPSVSGDHADYTLEYTPTEPFVPEDTFIVSVTASDLAGNSMATPYSYSFTISDKPETPLNNLPSDGYTNEILRPLLVASDFSDQGDAHAATKWQISYASGGSFDDNIVYSMTSSSELTSHRVVDPLLHNTYYWRVSYQDNHGAWSDPSAITSFTTGLLWTNMTAVWHFDENEASTAYDSSGNAYDGTIYGAIWNTDVNRGVVLSFAGTTDNYVRVPNGALNNLTDFSVEFWAKVADFGSSNQGIISAANASQPDELLVYNQANLAVFIKGVHWDSGVAINNGNWHHIVITRDIATNEVKMYMDGNLQNTTTSLPGGAISVDADALIIGQDQDAGGVMNESFKGELDEIVTYQVCLSANQVIERFRGTELPYTSGHIPAKGATDISPKTNIVLHVKDSGAGVDQSSIELTVGGSAVTPVITGDVNDYTVTYSPPADFAWGELVNVTVDAADLAGNIMKQDSYSFTILSSDNESPVTSGHNPERYARMVPQDTNITIIIQDLGGVNLSSLIFKVNGSVKYDGSDPASYPDTAVTGNMLSYTIVYNPPIDFGLSSTVNVELTCEDLFGNVMSPDSYYFTINTPPLTPNNDLPADGSGTIRPPALVSSNFEDGDIGNGDFHRRSQWQITTNPENIDEDGSYILPDYNSGAVTDLTTHIPSSPLLPNTVYYWHVRHQDSLYAWSEYSADTSFITASNNQPGRPDNVSPYDGEAEVSATPTLQSTAFDDPDSDIHAASHWEVSTASGAGFEDNIVYSTTSASELTAHTITSPLTLFNSVYYWRVKHQDGIGSWSDYSEETSFISVNMPEGAVAYWKFNETSGNTAYDETSNGHNGQIVGGTANWAVGKEGNALNLDGIDDYVNVGDMALNAPATVGIWVNKNAFVVDARLLSQLSGALTQGGALRYNFTQLEVWNGTNWQVLISSGLAIETWQHIVIVYDGTNVTAYLNGIEQGSGTSSFDFNGINMGIGAMFKGVYGNTSNGLIDEVIIYDRALTCEEVIGLYRSLGDTGGNCP